MPKDRGAEQGDVDGPLECSLALGMAAAEARGNFAARQAAGTLPWIGVNDRAEVQRLQAEDAARVQESANSLPGGPDLPTGSHHQTWQTSGTWTTSTSCATQFLVLPFQQDVDVANARVGAERNPLKTEVIYYVNAAPPEWKTDEVRSMAKISAVTSGSITLGVAIGSQQFITDQLLSKADVIRAMRERVQLCQYPLTEFALLRESLGVSRINHILRVVVAKSLRN